jgi:hypothetical protein
LSYLPESPAILSPTFEEERCRSALDPNLILIVNSILVVDANLLSFVVGRGITVETARAFFASNTTGLGSTRLFVDLNGKAHALWQQKSNSLTWGIPSPDGRHLAVLGEDFNSNMWMIENF